MSKPLVIAIDGPAGAGKSTVARMLAERLGLDYVDSGATYRAAALCVLEAKISPENEQAVVELIGKTEIKFRSEASQSRVWLNGRDVSDKIRTPEVSLAASKVSRLPEVRRKLIGLQRSMVQGRGVVMEGRDIGTVVFPDAALKIFLIADPEERARRRLRQDIDDGRGATLEQTAYEIGRRDQLDAARKISPLVRAPDAYEINSTRLTSDEVVECLQELLRKKLMALDLGAGEQPRGL